MTFNPDESWFVSFHEHDPSTDHQCIYFTKKKARCTWPCQKEDNEKAIKLYEIIGGLPTEVVGIDLIKSYILNNCCRSGRARHRDRIEDVGLWTPLAERWLDEIRRHAEQLSCTPSVPSLEESALIPDLITPPAIQSLGQAPTVCATPTDSSFDLQPTIPTTSSMATTSPASIASSSAYQNTLLKSPTTSAEIEPLLFRDQPHHYRLCDTNISTNAIPAELTTISQPPLSEFRAHIAEPNPTDSVSSKLGEKLVGRDFESGSLYIFNRDKSPGHVKIGWTAQSVERRLEAWSKCEYTPNLLFSVDNIPNAQRAETLTHYELIKQWRRERQCKAKHCRKSHQEWFEVSKERAKEVLGGWAKFIRKAEPYDSEGVLKARWKHYIERAVKSREAVTAKKLLEHYELSLAKDTMLVHESVDPGHVLKIKEEEDKYWNTQKLKELGSLDKVSVHLDSLLIEPPAKRAPAYKLLPEQIPLPPSPILPYMDSQSTLFIPKAEPD